MGGRPVFLGPAVSGPDNPVYIGRRRCILTINTPADDNAFEGICRFLNGIAEVRTLQDIKDLGSEGSTAASRSSQRETRIV